MLAAVSTAALPPLHFYFDFISPFGYFASLRIEELAARHGRTVEWHAMLLGVSVLKVMGLKPLLDTPLKGDYIRREVARYSRRHGLTIKRSLDEPINDPRPAARAFYWVKHHRPESAPLLAHAIYHAYWAEGQDISTPEAVAATALPASVEADVNVGLDSDWLLEGIRHEDSAKWLRSGVDASLKAGVFGSPSVVVDGELFWGLDKFAQLDEWLATGGW